MEVVLKSWQLDYSPDQEMSIFSVTYPCFRAGVGHAMGGTVVHEHFTLHFPLGWKVLVHKEHIAAHMLFQAFWHKG